mmetsp:Transcript_54514/g.130000  ORF Transcript_54514/g.130000 Transcript_54514/m.130000 type:complete len:831 (-) Transcript_54514:38-2530(-)
MIGEDTLLPAYQPEYHPADDYEVVRQIGSGSFGDVFLVRHRQDQRQYVMKSITLLTTMDAKQRESTELEVRLLSGMSHPNIVAYRDSFTNREGHLCIFMEHCEHGDVYSYMREAKQAGKLPEERILLEWFIQSVFALNALHQRRILHRDLKTQNIFLTGPRGMSQFALKLGDFGIAKVLDSTTDLTKTQIGTPFYMSPELINNKPYSYKSDIWGLGCVLYELINGHHAFEARSLNGLAFKIMRGKYTPITANCSEDSQALIKAMLTMNPAHRPALQEILHLAFLRRKVKTVFHTVLNATLPEARQEAEKVLVDQLGSLGLARLVNQAGAGHTKDSRKLQQRLERLENRRRREETALNKLEHSAAALAQQAGGRNGADGRSLDHNGITASSVNESTAGFFSRGVSGNPGPSAELMDVAESEAASHSRFWAEPGHYAANGNDSNSRKPQVHARFDLEGDRASDPSYASAQYLQPNRHPDRMHRSISPARTSPEPFYGTGGYAPPPAADRHGNNGQHRLRALTELPSQHATPRDSYQPSDPSLSPLLGYKHITPANLANPFQRCRPQVVHSPKRGQSRDHPPRYDGEPKPPPPQFGKAPLPSHGPPQRQQWSHVRSTDGPMVGMANRSVHSVCLESLNFDRTSRDLSEESQDLASDGALSDVYAIDTGRSWGGAAEPEGLQQRIESYRAALIRRQMSIETLQYRLAEAQAAEAGDWSSIPAELPSSSRHHHPHPSSEAVGVYRKPAMPAIVQDRLTRSIRCCIDGLGSERFQAAKQSLQALLDAAEVPQVLRQHMQNLLGLDKIGYYSLIDQIVHMERRWGPIEGDEPTNMLH